MSTRGCLFRHSAERHSLRSQTILGYDPAIFLLQKMPPGADADLPPDVAVLDLSRSTTVDISLSQYSITSNKSFSASRYLGRSRNEIVPLGTSTRNLMLLQAEALFPQPEISNQQEQIEW